MNAATAALPLTSAQISTLLQAVLDEMLEGFQIISNDWRYLYVNNTVAKQAKKKKEDLLGKTMMQCFPGIDATPLFEQLKKAVSEKVSIRMENKFVFEDGSYGWFQLFIHPVHEGILIFSIDITEKKRAEQKLQDKITDVNELMESAVDRETKMAELKSEVQKLQSFIPHGAPAIIK